MLLFSLFTKAKRFNDGALNGASAAAERSGAGNICDVQPKQTRCRLSIAHGDRMCRTRRICDARLPSSPPERHPKIQ